MANVSIKEVPINFRKHWTSATTTYKNKLKDVENRYNDKVLEEKALYEDVKSNLQLYKDKYNINLQEYPEFVENKYIDGKFLRIAKGILMNKAGGYILVPELNLIYSLALTQRSCYNLEHDIKIYTTISKLTMSEYTELLRAFYTIVHRKLILEGLGYVFGHNIGWTCINRCIIKKALPVIDYQATKKRKAEIIAEGKRPYSKTEEDWCKENGFEYDGVKYLIYKNNEYCYDIPLLRTMIEGAPSYKLTIADYIGTEFTGMTYDEIIDKYNADIDKICNLKLSLRIKLMLCDRIDKTLYIKFIRNENQTSATFSKINRKDRQ